MDFGGAPILSLALTVPGTGAASGRVAVDSSADLLGARSLTIDGDGASTTMAMYATAGGAWQGRASYYLRACVADGLVATLAARSYHAETGVRLATVLADVASEIGETIAYAGSATLGWHYARVAGPAYSVLDTLVPGWWVDGEGTIQTAARATSTLVGRDYELLDYDPGERVATVSPLRPAEILPGRTIAIDGVTRTIQAVRWTAPPLRAWLDLGDCATDRLWTAMVKAVAKAAPAWHGLYRYRVVSAVADGRCALSPVSDATGLPQIESCRARSLSGMRAQPQSGAECLVAFADGDAGWPVIVAWGSTDGDEWEADHIDIDSTGAVGSSGTIDMGESIGEIPDIATYYHHVVRYGDVLDVGGVPTLVKWAGPKPPSKVRA